MSYPRKQILGTSITIISKEKAVFELIQLAFNRQSSYTCFVNVHMTIESQTDEILKQAVTQSTLSLADGMPVAKAIKWLYNINQERLAGMDFLPILIDKAHQQNLSIFFYGSTPEMLQITQKYIKNKYPDINIAGTLSPPFRELSHTEIEDHIAIINSSQANLVFVALGCPKQEKWMAENCKDINATLLGIGGALEVFVKAKKRAPLIIQQIGMEWLYRLIQDPKRLWKRYLKTNSQFMIQLTKEILRHRK